MAGRADVLRAKGDVDADALASYAVGDRVRWARLRIAAAQSRSGFAKQRAAALRRVRRLDARETRTGSAPAAAEARAPRCPTDARAVLRVAEVRNYFENQCSVPDVFDARSGSAVRSDVVVIYPLVFADRTEILASAGDRTERSIPSRSHRSRGT